MVLESPLYQKFIIGAFTLKEADRLAQITWNLLGMELMEAGLGSWCIENDAIQPSGLFLTNFQTVPFQTWIYIRAANYG